MNDTCDWLFILGPLVMLILSVIFGVLFIFGAIVYDISMGYWNLNYLTFQLKEIGVFYYV